MAGKGSQRRPTLISRELDYLNWCYAYQGKKVGGTIYPKMTFAEYAKRLKELKKRGLAR